jgi:hypothetical protein
MDEWRSTRSAINEAGQSGQPRWKASPAEFLLFRVIGACFRKRPVAFGGQLTVHA